MINLNLSIQTRFTITYHNSLAKYNFITNIYYIFSIFTWQMRYETLIASGKTVFTIQDCLLLFPTTKAQTVRNFFQRMKKKWIMCQAQWGIRTFKEYDHYELWSKLKKNSYISCETVLKQAGIIFQRQGNSLTFISDNTLQKSVDWWFYTYRKIQSTILLEPTWIIHTNHYAVATPERALCDMIYLSPDMYFDDLSSLSREKIKVLSQYYPPHVLSRLTKLFNDNIKQRIGIFYISLSKLFFNFLKQNTSHLNEERLHIFFMGYQDFQQILISTSCTTPIKRKHTKISHTLHNNMVK